MFTVLLYIQWYHVYKFKSLVLIIDHTLKFTCNIIIQLLTPSKFFDTGEGLLIQEVVPGFPFLPSDLIASHFSKALYDPPFPPTGVI